MNEIKRTTSRIMTILLITVFSASLWAQQGTNGEIKAGAKQTGQGVKRTAKAIGHKTRRVAKSIGQGVKKTTRDVKKEVKK